MERDGASFGVALRCCRRDVGLSQTALADRAGFSAVYIGMLERGQRLPIYSSVELIADALDLDQAGRAGLHAARRRDADCRTERAGVRTSTSTPDVAPSRLADGIVLVTFIAVALGTLAFISSCFVSF